MAVDFSFLDDILSDSTDYSYMFDDSGDGAVNLDFDYDPSNSGIGSFDYSSLFGDDDDYSYLFGSDDAGIANLDFDYKPGVDFSDVYNNLFNDDTDYKNLFDYATDLSPTFDDLPFQTENAEQPGILDIIAGFFGADRKGGKDRAQGIMQTVGGGITDFANSPIGQLLLANYLKDKNKEDRKIPLGAEAYGDQGLGSMPDYRIFNLQPALMPGVGYANAPPPKMKHGGIHGAGKDDGPGDITLARLEPGEFVMTRKATDNIGAKNLYSLMKQAERMG